MAIAFAGTAPFGAQILDGLLAARDDVVLAISQPSRPAGRGRGVRAPAVAQLATERDLPLIQPQRTHDPAVIAELQRLGVTTIVVAAFGQMIREPLLSDYLMLNVHGSLLPAYRGAAPVERAIMDGQSRTGVCIMAMEAGLDTGAVARRSEFAIGPDDDAGAIYAHMAEAGVRDLLAVLDAAERGAIEWTPQDDALATYAHKILAADRALDPSASGRALHDRVRALSPHIGAFANLPDGARLTIWRTQPVEGAADGEPGTLVVDGSALLLVTGDGLLELSEVQPAGKRRMATSDWLRGLRAAPARIEAPEVPAP